VLWISEQPAVSDASRVLPIGIDLPDVTMSPHEGDLFPVSQERGRAVVGAFLVGPDPAPFVIQVQDGEVRFVIPARDAKTGKDSFHGYHSLR
jgi:hypothetical protein